MTVCTLAVVDGPPQGPDLVGQSDNTSGWQSKVLFFGRGPQTGCTKSSQLEHTVYDHPFCDRIYKNIL